MRKLSVFYEHILQACEQSGKTIPEVLARSAGSREFRLLR